MSFAVVVDIGNSRMKWGRIADGTIAENKSLPHDDADAWKKALENWNHIDGSWLICGVVPRAVNRFRDWLAEQQVDSLILDNRKLLDSLSDFRTAVEEPERIGIDRLLNSYAAFRLANREAPGMAAVAISVGTATTIDFMESDGTHQGGAILPGPLMMAKSLHEETAKLPFVSVGRFLPTRLIGQNTEEAIVLGITRATVHAADGLIADWALASKPYNIYLTGGHADLFRDFLFAGTWTEVAVEPALALEGLRLVAEKLP